MRAKDMQLLRLPRGYRKMIRKAAETEGVSVNEWMLKRISGDLTDSAAETRMVGEAAGKPPEWDLEEFSPSSDPRSNRLKKAFNKLGSWIISGRSVFHKPVDKYLDRPQLVQVTIPLKGGGTKRLSAIAKLRNEEGRSVLAEFPEDTLPPGKEIDTNRQCLVTFKLNGPPVYMPATIEAIPDKKQLILKNKGYVSVPPERRTALRINANFALEYKRRNQQGFNQAQSIDINTKGIQFQCPDHLQKEEILVLNMEIPRPRQHTVFCTAQVAWSSVLSDNSKVAGCRFLDLSERDQDAIAAFCFMQELSQKSRPDLPS